MPSYERGTYEPSDEVRVFDGREDDEEDEEGSRLPILIVMALLVLAAFGGVVWLAYERGVASGRTEPRVITAEQGPVKVAPPASANAAEAPYKGLKIYEQPAPSDEESGEAATAASPPPAAAKPAPVVAAAAPPAAAPSAMIAAPKPAAPKPAVEKPAAKPVAMAAASPPPAMAAPKPAPVVAKPAPTVAAVTNNATTSAPPTVAAKPTPAPPAPETAKPAAAGGYVLQIGAYKSQGEADASWKTFAAKHAALLAGFTSDVKQVDLGEKGTWYRLRIGSFADKDAASALCDKLKADGGNCFLAK